MPPGVRVRSRQSASSAVARISMERFFLEHHVMKDRDADELARVASDSEASEDEQDVTDRVHSVHDPTGPWAQRAVDSDCWGHAHSAVGKPKRDFRSQHTGPKGVIKDYKEYKMQKQNERKRKEQERSLILNRIAKGVTVISSDAAQSNSGDQGDDSDSDDDELIDDAFLQQYQRQRIAQMQSVAQSRPVFGQLEYLSPEQFVDMTDKAENNVVQCIHLYDPESYPCTLLNTHLTQIAQQRPHAKFAAVVAKEADPSIAARDLPVLLIYRGQQHVETIVNVSQELDGEFTLERIDKYVSELLGL